MQVSDHYNHQEQDKIKRLAEQIKQSQRIDPLIVVIDSKGPYILEGSHRSPALKILGARSFPALVVIDRYDLSSEDEDDDDAQLRHERTGIDKEREHKNLKLWSENMSKAKQFTEKLQESYPARCKMFSVENDTDKWILLIDGLYGFVDSEKDAKQIIKSAIPDDMIDNSFFGSYDILPPHFKPKYKDNRSDRDIQKISKFKPINIKDFAIKYGKRQLDKWRREETEKGQSTPAKDRLVKQREQEHAWDFLFDK